MTTAENRARLVLGNWKMHGNLAENAALLAELRAADAAAHCEMGVCVPFPYLAQTAAALQGSAIGWGAQDVSAHANGGGQDGIEVVECLADLFLQPLFRRAVFLAADLAGNEQKAVGPDGRRIAVAVVQGLAAGRENHVACGH
ncbi:triose-phosphate isomerase-like protein [Bordetella pertussis H934]|nr:triose-phosphate isomerase-like protein [Bordetella pertussis H934]